VEEGREGRARGGEGKREIGGGSGRGKDHPLLGLGSWKVCQNIIKFVHRLVEDQLQDTAVVIFDLVVGTIYQLQFKMLYTTTKMLVKLHIFPKGVELKLQFINIKAIWSSKMHLEPAGNLALAHTALAHMSGWLKRKHCYTNKTFQMI